MSAIISLVRSRSWHRSADVSSIFERFNDQAVLHTSSPSKSNKMVIFWAEESTSYDNGFKWFP